MATIVALVVHAVSLLGDKFLHPSLADIAIPFASRYKTVWMTMGIVGGWMMIILGLSFYARGRIGQQRWRKLHRFTALAWILGLAHSLGEGTDAGKLWFLVATGIVVLPAARPAGHPHVATRAPRPVPSHPRRSRDERRDRHRRRRAWPASAARRPCAAPATRAASGCCAASRARPTTARRSPRPSSRAPRPRTASACARQSWYADRDVELLLGARAAALDCARHVVTLDDGHAVGYEQLLIATGSRPRRLALLDGFANVHTLRTLEDARAPARRARRGRAPGRRRRRLHRPGGRGRGRQGRRARPRSSRPPTRRSPRCSAPWSGPGSPTCIAARASTSSSARASPRRPAPTASSS